jgi:hypothetical protein
MMSHTESAAILDKIRSRTNFFDPPAAFDPLKASAAELLKYGFSLEPDPAIAPERHASWMRLFSQKLNFVAADFALPPLPEFQRPGRRKQAVVNRQPHEMSLNWCGAYVTAKDARTFTEIHADWKVPRPDPPIQPGSGVALDGDYRSSTWIGFDGQRRYLNSSLPQIGTAQEVVVVNGQPRRKIYAWVQWWVSDHRSVPVVLSSLPISAGDLVTCSMVVMNRTTVRFYIKNQSTGYFVAPFEQSAPLFHPPDGGEPVQLEVSGATAQWIVERPAALTPGHALFELPDYGTVTFSNCYAVSSSHGTERPEGLNGATLINMRATREHPHRSAVISRSKRQDMQSVVVHYGGGPIPAA